jgi:hypothetical protein
MPKRGNARVQAGCDLACIELGAKANQRGSTIDCNDVIEVTLEYDLKEAKTMLGKFGL